MEEKIVQKFGNSSHIVLPKDYIGRRIRFIAEPKTFYDIKSEILEIVKPYLENVVGVYLYGSYARSEQTIDSDVDVLVITDSKLRIMEKISNYAIISATVEEIDNLSRDNAVLILPIIKEAKTIVNPVFLGQYKDVKFTKSNTKKFIADSSKVLELNKKGLQLGFQIGSLVYSLILRIRGLLMIKLMLNNSLYSKALLFEHLENNNFKKNKVKELYNIYNSEKNDIKVKESNIITKEDIEQLIAVAEKLLDEVKGLLK